MESTESNGTVSIERGSGNVCLRPDRLAITAASIAGMRVRITTWQSSRLDQSTSTWLLSLLFVALLTSPAAAQRLFVSSTQGNDVGSVAPLVGGDQIPGTHLAGGTTGLNTPEGLDFDSVNNELWVGSQSGNGVLVFDGDATGDTAPLRSFTTSGSPREPAYDSGRDILYVSVSDGASSRVAVYDNPRSLNGGTPGANRSITGLGSSVYGLELDRTADRLFVVQSGGTVRVVIIDNASTRNGQLGVDVPFRQITAGLVSPRGLAFDRARDRLYVSQDNASVAIYAQASTTDLPAAPTAVLAGALTGLVPDTDGVEIDLASDDLYVATASPSNSVRVFANAGSLSGVVDLAPSRVIAGGNTQFNGPGGLELALGSVVNSVLGPSTLSGYDTCDITTGTPAATLLLPYFEIDPSGLGENTLVTITNVSDTSIVAHVTVWTNWSYPVLDFNIFLTGYDVQSLSLRSLLVNGDIPNTARNTTTSPRGVRSTRSSTWIQAPYNTGMTPSCDSAQGGVGAIPGFLLPAIQSALTGGPYSVGAINCPQVADESDSYVGYITVDTTHVCSQSLPTDPGYFGAAGEIRHENQLTGDYIRLNDAGGYAGGNPLVHIVAIPGGDPALGATTLTSSFYQRYQAGFLTTDRRQPLPGLFAARYIEPGTAANFDTDFVVWREGVTTNAACQTISRNASFPYVEIVRFDERENPTTTSFGCQVSPCLDEEFGLSETQLVNLSNPIFPPDSTSADPGGWMYLNLQHAEFLTRPSQNWVQIRMTGAGVYGVDFDAAYLGNGCQGFVGETSLDDGAEKIGPKFVPGSELLWSGN